MSKIFIINGRSGSTLIDHILYHHEFKPVVPMGVNSTEAHELRLSVIHSGAVQAWLKTHHDWNYCKCCELGACIPEVLEVFPKAKFIIMDRDDVEIIRSTEALGWGKAAKAFFLSSSKWWAKISSQMGSLIKNPESLSNFEASCYHFLYPKKKAYNDLHYHPYSFHVVSFQYLMSDFRTELKKLFVALDYDLSKIDWEVCEKLRFQKLQHTDRSDKDIIVGNFDKRLFDFTSNQIQFIRSLKLV